MRAHASWGSLNDVMLVFMNQDAYDKFRLSKEDYELQKELEKEQKNTTETKKTVKRKVITKKIRREERGKVKDIVVELNNIEDRIVRLTPNSSDLGSAIITKTVKPYITSLPSKAAMTCGNESAQERHQVTP